MRNGITKPFFTHIAEDARKALTFWEIHSLLVGEDPYIISQYALNHYFFSEYNKEKFKKYLALQNKSQNKLRITTNEQIDLKNFIGELKKDQKNSGIIISLLLSQDYIEIKTVAPATYRVTPKGFSFYHPKKFYQKEWFVTALIAGGISLVSGIVESGVDKYLWGEKVEKIIESTKKGPEIKQGN